MTPRRPPWQRAAVLALGLLAFGLLVATVADAEMPDSTAPNVVRLTMRTPRGGFDRLVVSVTVCEPGTERCARIDDVMVDTGSTGLRLEASSVPHWLHLPPFRDRDGRALAECLHFVHDDAWGPLDRADLRIGELVATDLPMQIIADDGRPQPAACPRSDVRPTANGTLGIGPRLLDCQGRCRQDPRHPGVFVEAADGFVPVLGDVAPAERLPNPVSRFPAHDNGVVFDLPMPPEEGAAAAAGTLTFGVGTAANNRLGGEGVVPVDDLGHVTTLYGGRSYPDSIIDSGTETLVLPDDALPRCEGLPWAYCAVPTRHLSADLIGRAGATIPVAFSVGDYRRVFDPKVGAMAGVAVAADPGSTGLVWGAPFFLGRRVFVVFEGKDVPGQDGLRGPFYAIR